MLLRPVAMRRPRRLWLLEFNACPSLWLSQRVIEDALAIVLPGSAGQGDCGSGGFAPFYAYPPQEQHSEAPGKKKDDVSYHRS